MSPNAAIIQGLIVGILIAVLEAFGWQWEAIGVAGGALALVILVAWIGRTPRRNFEDAPGSGRVKEEGKEAEAVELKKIGLSVGLLVAPGLIVLLFKMLVNDFGDVPHGPSRGTALAMILIAAVAGDLIYMSTLTDWFYVRPYLRGGCGSICATSLEDQWRGVTRIWLLHRALAVLGAIAAVTALTALAANTWIRPIDEVVAGAIGGVAAVIAGYYLTRAASLLAIAINPPVQVGDVIEIAEEFNVYEPDELREYFVVDVALEGVKLLRLGRDHLITRSGPDAKRTHDRTVDVMDISKLLRGRRAVKPCADKCQKLTEHCDCKVAWTLPKRTEASTAAPKPA